MWSIAGLWPLKSFNCDMHSVRTSCFYAFSSLSKLSVSSVIRHCLRGSREAVVKHFQENSSLKGVIAHLHHGGRSNSSRQPEYTRGCTSHKDLPDVLRRLHSFIWEKCVIRLSWEEEKWLLKICWEAFRQMCAMFPNEDNIFIIPLSRTRPGRLWVWRPRSLFSVSI